MKIHMKRIKVLMPFSQAVLLLEMYSEENHPREAKRCLHADVRCRVTRMLGRRIQPQRLMMGMSKLIRNRREQT